MAGELRDKGGAALKNGWRIIPIPPGGKRPVMKDWPRYVMTEPERAKLVANGHARDGFGIIAKDTPGIDIDILDAAGAQHMQDWAAMNIGLAPIRIGQPPRRLLVYRTDKPFPKISSNVYLDDQGRKAQIEILCKGQQYVAEAVHPDRKAPYTWRGGSSGTIHVDGLSRLMEEDGLAFKTEFERYAEKDRVWTLLVKSRQDALAAMLPEDELALAAANAPLDLSEDEIKAYVNRLLPNSYDRGTWVKILGGIKLETGGSKFGHDVALEFSEAYDGSAGEHGHDEKEFETTWNSLEKGTDFRKATFRTIIDLGNEKAKGKPSRALDELRYDDIRPRLIGNDQVEGLVQRGSLVCLYGAKNTAKTGIAIYLGLCISSGRPFFGRRVRQGGVVYVAAEAGKSIANRLAAAKQQFGDGLPFTAITSPVDLRSNDADIKRLVESIEKQGFAVDFIEIDTKSRAFGGGDENTSQDNAAFILNMDRLRDQTAATIFITDHPGKNEERGIRGHSSFTAAVDTIIKASHSGAVFKLEIENQREFACEGFFRFSLIQVVLGINEWGKPVTSYIIDETGFEAVQEAKPLSPTNMAFVREAEQLCEASPDRRISKVELLKKCASNSNVTLALKENTQLAAARRIYRELLALGYFEEFDGFVSLKEDFL